MDPFFKVALTWDSRTLLIPSLLPTEQQMRSGLPGMDMRVKIAVRTRGWGFRGRRVQGGGPVAEIKAASSASGARSRSVPSRQLLKSAKISRPIMHQESHGSGSSKGVGKGTSEEYEMSKRSEAEHCIRR